MGYVADISPMMGRRSLLLLTHAGQQNPARALAISFLYRCWGAARPPLVPCWAERLVSISHLVERTPLAQAPGARHVSGFAIRTPVSTCSFSRAPFSPRSLDKRGPEPPGQDGEPPLPGRGLTDGPQALVYFPEEGFYKTRGKQRGRSPEITATARAALMGTVVP